MTVGTKAEDPPIEDNVMQQSAAPLLEHLIELRQRLLYAMLGVLIAFAACYSVADHIYDFLVHPLASAFESQEGRRMIYTGLHEAFFTKINLAFFGAHIIALL